ncbi:MAG TPA: hypothetical protein VGJ94_12230 [Syntrophorhabdaceae bacterium]|jgi:rubrerythrin
MATKKTEGADKAVKAKAAPKKEPEKKSAAKGKPVAPAAKRAGAPKKAEAPKTAAATAKSVKSVKAKAPKNGAVKKGSKFECAECGMVVVVDEACSCPACDLICCGESMELC